MTPNELLQQEVLRKDGAWILKGDSGDHLPEVCKGTLMDVKRDVWSYITEKNNRVAVKVFKDNTDLGGEYVGVVMYSYIPVMVIRHFGTDVAFPSSFVINNQYFTEMCDYLNNLRREVEPVSTGLGMDEELGFSL